jgi:hypothetical protein
MSKVILSVVTHVLPWHVPDLFIAIVTGAPWAGVRAPRRNREDPRSHYIDNTYDPDDDGDYDVLTNKAMNG